VFYRRLADLIVVFHAVLAVYFLLGAFLARAYPWTAFLHLPLAMWVCTAYLFGWTCPLTPLEIRFRQLAGGQGYEGGFVDHYLGWAVGLEPTMAEHDERRRKGRRAEVFLGIFFIATTLVFHAANWRKYHNAVWPPQSPPATVKQEY
jgi:hypothetical protein